MKLVLAIIQEKDAGKLQAQLNEHKIIATQLPTKGGFLRAKNVTYMVGINDERVPELLDLIKHSCQARDQYVTPPINLVGSINDTAYPVEVEVGGATVMVLPIEDFFRF
ncbi:cyclic-di-AMP receptor [Fructilactobacillus carniphilus]|uniref:Cyclic-di-AMP receptor n=1 Tax=Fructilactobacillus carniphilus TaxID=2940297 RepID=A0ABY5BWA9_9LACO|nr:cyclic-di-AMP receptor [Fructilactobacillus carniphilus]USS90089.1 cyclic-di-AMP receptor [Fructilactobacillus carniphilus]